MEVLVTKAAAVRVIAVVVMQSPDNTGQPSWERENDRAAVAGIGRG